MPLRLAIALLLSPLPAAGDGFFVLDLPGSQLTALADDGRSAAGSLAGAAGGGFRWQRDHGARLLPGAVSVNALSPSGRYAAGSSLDRNGREVATWWDADGTAHPVENAPGSARAIDDARGLRGVVRGGDARDYAYAWSSDGGLRHLSDDTATPAPARCAQADGSPPSADLPQPVEYAAASRDGALRVGHAGRGAQRLAIVWTPRHGAQRLDAFLAAHGVEVPADWRLVAATAIDPHARRIGGYGLHRHRFDSFIAELPTNVRILCDSSIPPTASQRRKPLDQSIPSQENTR